MKWHPLRFLPIYKERVWGGRRLAEIYGRALPPSVPMGESWEITDRKEGVSVVAEGPLAGRSISDLLEQVGPSLLGDARARGGRFPLLVKILDAREILSLQVHPPAHRVPVLGGEPKTEMWYFTATEPGAEILAGLKRGVSQAEFERRLASGTVADCFHRIGVRPGDAMLLPSGRVHALGAGVLLYEIQENSDTTFRVFDWNRLGLDGKPRPLHVRESLESIDFTDFQPGLVSAAWQSKGPTDVRELADDPCFRVEARRAAAGVIWPRDLPRCAILGVVRGTLAVDDAVWPVRLGAGDFCLLPAALGAVKVRIESDAEWLVTEPGRGDAVGRASTPSAKVENE